MKPKKSDIETAVIMAVALGSTALAESKYLGSRKTTPVDLDADLIIRTRKDVDPEGFAKKYKSLSVSARRSYANVKATFQKELLKLLRQYEDGKETNNLSEFKFTKLVKAALKKAYTDAYTLGKHSSGMADAHGLVTSDVTRDTKVPLTIEDRRWLASAIRHENKFLNKFIKDIVAGTGRMPYKRRAKMYVQALDNIFNSARVQGMPSSMLLYWVTSKDEVCESCLFLEEMGPFTKDTIPTLPRSGATKCLTNCKCKVIQRPAKPEQLRSLKLRSKTYLLRRLIEIKRGV